MQSPPSGWSIVEGHHLEREDRFPDFQSALGYVNRVAALAEEMDHHPDVYLAWGRVRLTLWTHTANGLTEKDFALAERITGLWHHDPGHT